MQPIPSTDLDPDSNEATAAGDFVLAHAQWSQLKKRRSDRRKSQSSGAAAAEDYGNCCCIEEPGSSPSCSRQLEPLLKVPGSTQILLAALVENNNADSDLTAEQHLADLERDLESPMISGIDDSDSAATARTTVVPDSFLAKGEIGTVLGPMNWKQLNVEEVESANELEDLRFVSVSEVLPPPPPPPPPPSPPPPPREFSTQHKEDIIESNAVGPRKLENDPQLGVISSMSYPQVEKSNSKDLQLDLGLTSFHEAENFIRSRGAERLRKRKQEVCEGEEWLELGLRTSTATPWALQNLCSEVVSSTLAGSENRQHIGNYGPGRAEIHVDAIASHLRDREQGGVRADITGGGFTSVHGDAGASFFGDGSGSSRDAPQQLRNRSYENATILNSPLLDTRDHVGRTLAGPRSQPNAISSRMLLQTTNRQSSKTENPVHLGPWKDPCAREEAPTVMPRNSAREPTPRLPRDHEEDGIGNSSEPGTADPLQLTGFLQASLSMQLERHLLQKTKVRVSCQDLWQTLLLRSVGNNVQQYNKTEENPSSKFPTDKHRKDSRQMINSKDPVPRRLDRSGNSTPEISNRTTTARGDRKRELWFTLRAAENQTNALSLLRQIPIMCIHIRSENVTISSVQKYVASKLGLLSKTEVKISCKGQELGANLTLHQIRDSIWQQPERGNTCDNRNHHLSGTTTHKLPSAPSFDGQLLEGKAHIYPDGSVLLAQDVVMVLTYSRPCP